MVTIGSYNILDDKIGPEDVPHIKAIRRNQNGASNWTTRSDQIVENIVQSQLDVICLQEVSTKAINGMREPLQKKGYTICHVSHEKRDDGLAIVFKNRFNLKEFKHDISLHGLRFCYVDIQDSTTNNIYRIADCHLLGGPQQDKGAEQIKELRKIVDLNPTSNYPLAARVIAGDFNTDQNNMQAEKLQTLSHHNYVNDGDTSETEIAGTSKGRHIDWIWVQKTSQIALNHIKVHLPNKNASDHGMTATALVPLEQKKSQPSHPAQENPRFLHNQPAGSFRERVMQNLKITGWDNALQNIFSKKIDELLTKHAQTKPFMPAVEQEFSIYVNSLIMKEEDKTQLKRDLSNAFNDAGKISAHPTSDASTKPSPKALAASTTSTSPISASPKIPSSIPKPSQSPKKSGFFTNVFAAIGKFLAWLLPRKGK